jgi:hypothetical protein
MSENIKIVSREELYNLVWSKPLTTLSKEYAYSDNGLRKICIKHNIPLPKSGYWSKLKFNKKVKKEQLPKGDDTVKIELYIRKEGQESINHPNSERAKIKQEIESNKELSFKVPDRLSNPHKYILATQVYHKELKERDRTRDWNKKLDSTNALSVNVSDKIYSRALRFMDTLLKLMEKRGHTVKISSHSTIIVFEQRYHLRLTEKNKRVKRETNYSWDEHDLEPTGILSLKIDRTYPLKEWSDTKTKPLEDKLADILAWIELRAKEDKEHEIANKIWHEKQEILRQKKEELQKKKVEELSKFESLFHTATRWHKSQYIRSFIKEFQDFARKNNTLNEENKQWIEWAKEKADWYDPFIEKEIKLLEDIDRDTLKPKRTIS